MKEGKEIKFFQPPHFNFLFQIRLFCRDQLNLRICTCQSGKHILFIKLIIRKYLIYVFIQMFLYNINHLYVQYSFTNFL